MSGVLAVADPAGLWIRECYTVRMHKAVLC